MSTYAFDFINGAGAIHFVDVGQYASDHEALVRARTELSASQSAVAVEVWRSGERISRLSRRSRAGLSGAGELIGLTGAASPAPRR